MGRVVCYLLGLFLVVDLIVAQETASGGAESLQQTTDDPGVDGTLSAQAVSKETATDGGNATETATGATDGGNATAANATTTTPRPVFNNPFLDPDVIDAREFYEDTVEFYDYWVSVVPWFALVANSLAFFGWGLLGKEDNVVRVLLMGLAIFDILSLINMMDRAIYFWTDYEFSLQQSTDGGCKYIQWIANSARNVSSYLILSFTFDRFLSVWFPMKRRSIMTVKTVLIAMAIIIVLSFAAETYMPTILFHRKTNGVDMCTSDPDDRHEMSVFSSIFRNGLGFLLPMIMVAILNVLVIVRLWKYQDYMARDPADSGRTRKAEARNRSLTIMLVTVSIFSFVVYLPKTIVFYMMLDGAYDYKKDWVTMYEFYSALYIVDAIAMLNYSCNFFFYCLGAHRFRRLLKTPFSYVQNTLRRSTGARQGWDLNGSVTQTVQTGQTRYASDSSFDSEIAGKTKPVETFSKV